MMRSLSRTLNSSVIGLRAAALLAAAVSGTGCAQSIGDIDRTQPDLIAKDHFTGQWFIRETVVDVPSTSPASFVGEPGSIETVVWEVQENWLVGYRAYEQVPGLDAQAESRLARPGSQPVVTGLGDGRDPELYKGNPVVAYRIESHVDVQRGYNARTGEQNNVISENTTDRPWFERGFIRVNWANNEVDSFLTEPRSFWPMFGESSTMSAFVPQNQGGADAFRMELGEDGKANYIDFTVRTVIEPSIVGCTAMFSSGIGDCTGEEIDIRTSLMKVDIEREQEYVPIVYDDRRMGEFGYFRVERPTYDRRLGNTFTGMIQLAGRHDIWGESRDAANRPLPYSARTLRPIRYMLSENYPESLIEVTQEMEEEYDLSLKQVAAAARGQEISDIEAELAAADPEGRDCLFCIDTNENNEARNGDLRYNFLYWVDEQQAVSPLGFGPSSLNPETGRIVSASAYVYGASVDRYAEYAKQIVELMIGEENGGLSEDDIVSGDYFRNAVRGDLNPIDPRKAARFDGLKGEASSRAILGDDAFERVTELAKLGTDALAPNVPGFDRARLELIVGTPLEAAMVPEEWARAEERGQPSYLKQRATALRHQAALQGQPAPVQGPLGHLSVTNWFGGDALKDLQALEDLASRKNLWLANFDDPAIANLARDVVDRGLADDDLFDYLRAKVYKAVMLHELGHTMGLRHNFAGSADALNYHDEYWDERVKTIEPVAQYIQAAQPSTEAFLRSNCAVQGPLRTTAGVDLVETDTSAACAEQRDNGMAEYQYSSIMDYAGRFNADNQGLGRYDVAALASGYGDLVEVFDDQAMAAMDGASQSLGFSVRQAALEANQVRNPILNQGIDNSMVYQGGAAITLSHYSNYPAMFGGHENISRRRFMPRAEYLDQLATANQLPAAERATLPVKVPYMACYDEFVDSVDTCHRWDQGADNYEIVANNLTAYREYYVFNNFQRDRVGFDSFQVYLRTAQRYFLPLTNMYQHWFWGAAVTRLAQLGTPRGELGALATEEGLFRLLNTMSTPDYGAHIYDPGSNLYQPTGGVCPEVVNDVLIPQTDAAAFMSMPGCVDVPRGVGRSFFSRYDSSGYDVFRRVLESGHFYDQMAALVALQQSNASIVGIGQDVQADTRTFRIPYNLVFKQPIETLFSSIYNENDANYGMHIMRSESRPAEVLQLSNFTGVTAEQARALPVIAPGRTYTTRVQSLVAGMNLMDGSLNATFAKQGQISLSGSGEQRTAPDGFDLVEVADPATGRVFVAYRKSDGTGGPWYAADLIDEAKAIVANPQASENEKTRVFGDIELVRFAFNIFGE